MPATHYHYPSPTAVPAADHPDAEMAVDGGTLELEDETSLACLCSPLLLRGGGDDHAAMQSPASSLMPETVVEQTPLSDGSMGVKATTITPHPNGYRDLKIEHFVVPASAVKLGAVDAVPGSPPPGHEYLTKVEYRVLSPGLELERPDDDMSTVYTAPAPRGDASSVISTRRRKRRKKRNPQTLCFVTTVFALVAMAMVVALARDGSNHYSPDKEADGDGDFGKNETENSTMVDPEPNATKAMLFALE